MTEKEFLKKWGLIIIIYKQLPNFSTYFLDTKGNIYRNKDFAFRKKVNKLQIRTIQHLIKFKSLTYTDIGYIFNISYTTVKRLKYLDTSKSKNFIKLNPGIGSRGYVQVGLRNKAGTYIKLLHRLVLETFVGPCPEGMQACHNDGNKTNNRLENLRWDTPKSNAKDRKKHGNEYYPKGELNNNVKLTELDIIKIKLLKDKIYQKDIAKIFFVSDSTISNIMTRKYWKHI